MGVVVLSRVRSILSIGSIKKRREKEKERMETSFLFDQTEPVWIIVDNIPVNQSQGVLSGVWQVPISLKNKAGVVLREDKLRSKMQKVGRCWLPWYRSISSLLNRQNTTCSTYGYYDKSSFLVGLFFLLTRTSLSRNWRTVVNATLAARSLLNPYTPVLIQGKAMVCRSWATRTCRLRR